MGLRLDERPSQDEDVETAYRPRPPRTERLVNRIALSLADLSLEGSDQSQRGKSARAEIWVVPELLWFHCARSATPI